MGEAMLLGRCLGHQWEVCKVADSRRLFLNISFPISQEHALLQDPFIRVSRQVILFLFPFLSIC